MTCRDLLKLERPEEMTMNLDEGQICPDDFDYLMPPDYCCNEDDDCTMCWNREISTERVCEIKNEQIKNWEEKCKNFEQSRDGLYKEFTELVKERDDLKAKLEKTEKEWYDEIVCCEKIQNDQIKEIEHYKTIIRTVEAITGGKILK